MMAMAKQQLSIEAMCMKAEPERTSTTPLAVTLMLSMSVSKPPSGRARYSSICKSDSSDSYPSSSSGTGLKKQNQMRNPTATAVSRAKSVPRMMVTSCAFLVAVSGGHSCTGSGVGAGVGGLTRGGPVSRNCENKQWSERIRLRDVAVGGNRAVPPLCLECASLRRTCTNVVEREAADLQGANPLDNREGLIFNAFPVSVCWGGLSLEGKDQPFPQIMVLMGGFSYEASLAVQDEEGGRAQSSADSLRHLAVEGEGPRRLDFQGSAGCKFIIGHRQHARDAKSGPVRGKREHSADSQAFAVEHLNGRSRRHHRLVLGHLQKNWHMFSDSGLRWCRRLLISN